MTTILWDTHGTEIVKTLAAERRAAGALASGLALTLVVVTEEDHAEEAQRAAAAAAAAHPCRLLVVVRRRVDADDRLDAEVQVGGRLGANEAVMMRMYGRLSLHAESVVLPLLASDAPVVTWWHGSTPDKLAWDALGVLAGRRVTDATTDEDPMAALKRRAKDYAPGDTDLAWTRTTPWRALLASAFDDMAETPTSAEVHAERGNPSAALLAGWLTARLRIKVKRVDSDGPGVTGVEVRFGGRDRLRIDRPDGYLATLSRTGITDRQLPAEATGPRRAALRGAAPAGRRRALRRRPRGDHRPEGPRQPAGDAHADLEGPREAALGPGRAGQEVRRRREEAGQAVRPGREEGHREEGGGDPQGGRGHGEAHREEGRGPQGDHPQAVARVTGR